MPWLLLSRSFITLRREERYKQPTTLQSRMGGQQVTQRWEVREGL